MKEVALKREETWATTMGMLTASIAARTWLDEKDGSQTVLLCAKS